MLQQMQRPSDGRATAEPWMWETDLPGARDRQVLPVLRSGVDGAAALERPVLRPVLRPQSGRAPVRGRLWTRRHDLGSSRRAGAQGPTDRRGARLLRGGSARVLSALDDLWMLLPAMLLFALLMTGPAHLIVEM